MTDWSIRFMELAHKIAQWSKDPRTKVGAIAVSDARSILETGFSGIPRGVYDNLERMQPGQKHLYMIHAEANVIANAARRVLGGSTLYVTHICCTQCAGLLINSGVKRVIVGNGTHSTANEQSEAVNAMFRESGVVLEFACEPA